MRGMQKGRKSMADDNRQLDQLWYTWSNYGLGAAQVGFRVRAASEGFQDIQGERYRRVDRFLRYDLPARASSGKLQSQVPIQAPVTLAFVNNGYESLLVRKVFIGKDLYGRNGNFFAHLVAGFPPEFTARDAIRLWVCPRLWVESEAGKQGNDTSLPRIPYTDIQEYVEHSQTRFHFNMIRDPLVQLLVEVFQDGMPEHIYTRGNPLFIAALIYGLTHCLPRNRLGDLTFTTYEGDPDKLKAEATLLGTINGEELSSGLTLQVASNSASEILVPDVRNCMVSAVDYLQENNVSRLRRAIERAENAGHQGIEFNTLLEIYKHSFHLVPLSIELLDRIFRHPESYLDDLGEAGTVQESADLLLANAPYWRQTGKKVVEQFLARHLPAAHPEVARVFEAFRSGLVRQLHAALKKAVLGGDSSDYVLELFQTLAPPHIYRMNWEELFIDFRSEELQNKSLSRPLWSVREWLLKGAQAMQPPLTSEQVLTWLHTKSWEHLEKLLKLDLPHEWEIEALWHMMRYAAQSQELPKVAVLIIKKREPDVRYILGWCLGQQSPDYTQEVVAFFRVLVQAQEPGDAQALLVERSLIVSLFTFLLDVVRKEATVIEQLFDIVPLVSPYHLSYEELHQVLTGMIACRKEVIAACVRSLELTRYVHLWLLGLSLKQLNEEQRVREIFEFLLRDPSLPENLALVRDAWKLILDYQQGGTIEKSELEKLQRALWVFQQMRPDIPLQTLFVRDIVPILVAQSIDELDVNEVLTTLESDSGMSRDDLIRVLASWAARKYEQEPLKLLPYFRVCMHKYRRASVIDAQERQSIQQVLQALFGSLKDQTLHKMSDAIGLSIYPPALQSTWQEWERARRHDNKAGNKNPLWPENQGNPARLPSSPSASQAGRPNELPRGGQPYVASSGSSQLAVWQLPVSETLPTEPVVPNPMRQMLPAPLPSSPTHSTVQGSFSGGSQAIVPVPPAGAPLTQGLPARGALLASGPSGGGAGSGLTPAGTFTPVPYPVPPNPVPPTLPAQSTVPADLAGTSAAPLWVAYFQKYQYGISTDEYIWYCQRMRPVLEYWVTYYQSAYLREKATKSFSFEVSILNALFQEFKSSEIGTQTSVKLITYLAENWLIEREISKRGNSLKVDMTTFIPETLLESRLQDLKNSAKLQLRYPDGDMQKVLTLFIRRARFIDQLESQAKWRFASSRIESWLHKERKVADMQVTSYGLTNMQV